VGAIELTAILWREREAVQAVLERQQELVEALRAAVPGAGDRGAAHRETGDRGSAERAWTDRASVERALAALGDVLDRLRPVVLTRDIEVSAVADEWGAPPGLALGGLPGSAPPGPWGGIFADHLRELSALAERSVALRRETHELLASLALDIEVRVPVSPETYAVAPGE
jgi:hypothetical protein